MPETLRPPEERDWPAIVDLANRSVMDVAGSGSQDVWARNRRAFNERPGKQHQRVAVASDTGELVGYVSVESRPDQPSGARIFVVTTVEDRDEIGARLLAYAFEIAQQLGVTKAWFVEYAADERLIAFLARHGFDDVTPFTAPGGEPLVMLTRRVSRDSG